MQGHSKYKIAHKLSMLAIAALLLGILLSEGCVHYKADIAQQFFSNKTSELNVTEQIDIKLEMFSDYAANLPAESGVDGDRLFDAIYKYYSQGQYANYLCKKAKSQLISCTAQGNKINWVAVLSPDGRFYTADTQTDWLNLRDITTYRISRLPLIHYQIYGQVEPEIALEQEWDDLRHYLQSELGANELPAWDDTNPATPPILKPGSQLKAALRQYAPIMHQEQIIEFDSLKIRGQPMLDQQANASRKMELSYEANFQEPIISASSGGHRIPAENQRKIKIEAKTAQQPAGSIVITTERSLSPLGAYTWIIPIIGIAFTLARDFLIKEMK